MVYNEFSTSPNNQATDTEIQGTDETDIRPVQGTVTRRFILDLRYNPGGYLSCATDLGSYLAPAQI